MGAIDAKLRGDIGTHAHCATHHVDIEAFDIEWSKQEFRAHIVVVEIGCVFPHALRVVLSLAVPVIRVAVNRIGSKRPPKGGGPVGRSIRRVDGGVAGAVPHQYVRKSIGSAIVEAAAHLLDAVQPEKNIECAVDVRIELSGAIDRLVAQREVECHQTVTAPVPAVELPAHVLWEQVFASHAHGGGRVDGTGDEAATFDRTSIRQAYSGSTTATHDDFLHVGPGDDR